MREFTVNLTPESAARVEEMRSRIGDAQSALTRLVQIVCAGAPPEAYAAAEKLQAAAWQLTQLRRVLEPQIQRECELFAVPRVVAMPDAALSQPCEPSRHGSEREALCE